VRMYGQVSIMERRLFYTEGTEEFRKSLKVLGAGCRDEISDSIQDLCRQWESGHEIGSHVNDMVYRHRIVGGRYRVFLKKHIMSVDNIKCVIGIPIYIVRRSEDEQYNQFINRIKKEGYRVTSELEDKVLEYSRERLTNVGTNLPLCPKDVIQFLEKLHGLNSYDFFADKVVVQETEGFCEWIRQKMQDGTLIIVYQEIRRLVERVNRGEIEYDVVEDCAFSHHSLTGRFWYLLQEDNGVKKLSLAADTPLSDRDNLQGSSGIIRAYPSYILVEYDAWRQIAEGSALSLPLSREEIEILNDILTNKRLPAFISGRAGSGKSTMLYYMFANYWYIMEEYRDKMLFLTYTKNLKDVAYNQVKSIVERIAMDHAQPDTFAGQEERFQVLRDFLRELICCVDDSSEEQYPDEKYLNFERFCTLYSQRHDHPISPDVCWHIIRTYIKGYYIDRTMRLEDYKIIDRKDKTVTEIEFKAAYSVYEWLTREHSDYWDELDIVRRILLNENCIREREYYIIFCDEAQDFTRIEFQLMFRLNFASRYNFREVSNVTVPIVMAGDALQTINPTGFRPEALKAMLYNLTDYVVSSNGKLVPCYQELAYNYRSSEDITKFSNLINLIRYTLLGINTSRYIKPQKSYHHSACIPPTFVSCRDFESNNSPDDFHIVVHPDIDRNLEKHEVIAKLRKSQASNLWTPLEIKGLERDCVIVYGFGDVLSRKLNGLSRAKEKKLSSAEFRNDIVTRIQEEKSSELRIWLEYFFSNLYVAVTRAVKGLFIVDTSEGWEMLWSLLHARDGWDDILQQAGDEWSDKHYFQQLIEDSRVVAEPRDYRKDAQIFYQEWQLRRNPAIGRRAVSAFLQIGDSVKANEIEAEIYEYEKQWKLAAEKYLEAENLQKAAVCRLREGNWQEAKQVSENCQQRDILLDWIGRWASLWDEWHYQASKGNERVQRDWLSEKFMPWINDTCKLLEVEKENKIHVRQQTKHLLREVYRACKREARRYLVEEVLQISHFFGSSYLHDEDLKGDLIRGLLDDYWQSAEYSKYVGFTEQHKVSGGRERDLYAQAAVKGAENGLRWLIQEGHYGIAARFWTDYRQPWVDDIVELSIELAKQGRVRDALYVAICGNHEQYLLRVLSMKQIEKSEKQNAVRKLIAECTDKVPEETLLLLLRASLYIDMVDETYKLFRLALSRRISYDKVAKYVRGIQSRSLLDIVHSKISSMTEREFVSEAFDLHSYLIATLSRARVPRNVRSEINQILLGYISVFIERAKDVASDSFVEISEMVNKIRNLRRAIQRYNFTPSLKAAILEDLDKLRDAIITSEQRDFIYNLRGKILEGSECSYKVLISDTPSISQGEDKKAYYFTFADTPIVVRLLKSDKGLICVNRETGDSKSFSPSVEDQEEELWDAGVIRVLGKEATIELNGERVMTVYVV